MRSPTRRESSRRRTCSPSSAPTRRPSVSARTPSSGRRSPVRTASPTPTTPTSYGRAVRQSASCARSAASSRPAGWWSSLPSCARSQLSAAAIRRCRSASWPGAAGRPPRRPRFNGGWPASSAPRSADPHERRAGRRGSSEDDLPLRLNHAPDRSAGRGLNPTPDERGPAQDQRIPGLEPAQGKQTRSRCPPQGRIARRDRQRGGGRMSVRVGINGFGRIGRNFFRAARKRGADIEFVAVNDLGDAKTMAHLLRYDSVLGPLDEEGEAAEGSIRVGGDVDLRLLNEKDPAALPWKELGVQVVLEST